MNPRLPRLPHLSRLPRLPRHPHGDRGSATAAVLIFMPVFLLLASFVIDLGGEISQRERATDLAQQAARYAAQDINTGTLRAQGGIQINLDDCEARVDQFARSSGLSPGQYTVLPCTSTAANQVSVSIRIEYTPILLGTLTGGTTWVTGSGSAQALNAPQ